MSPDERLLYAKVVDAETGEEFDNVTRVTIVADAKRSFISTTLARRTDDGTLVEEEVAIESLTVEQWKWRA